MNCTHIIFDLDNTLYAPTDAMDEGIRTRMIRAVADYFGTSYDAAVALRQKQLPYFSTTLEWLRSEGLPDPERYFAQVHPAHEADELAFDPHLRPLLESIPLPKSILTNAPREHAERVLAKLNVSDLFTSITDIRDCALQGKPYPAAYRLALERAGCTIEHALFLDDQYKYTAGWEALGGVAVLVGTQNGTPLHESALPSSTKKNTRGKTVRIDSVYEVPALLKRSDDL
ncbi:MAG: HAD-IA family hydrolase [Treponema sp.]|nr:HAD-IA family hydrolase [Treponema sp.]